MPSLLADESASLGQGAGPALSHMLLAVVANCLSASLLFALQKFKQDGGDITARATCTVDRNESKRLRIWTWRFNSEKTAWSSRTLTACWASLRSFSPSRKACRRALRSASQTAKGCASNNPENGWRRQLDGNQGAATDVAGNAGQCRWLSEAAFG
jgi:hypothetical protein